MKGIYQTNDKRLTSIMEPSDVLKLEDILYLSDDNEFYIEKADLKKLKGKIESELFEGLRKAIEDTKDKAISFRIY